MKYRADITPLINMLEKIRDPYRRLVSAELNNNIP
jgi:hypothetical protein